MRFPQKIDFFMPSLTIKWCGTGRGRYRFDTTGTMIFADCPLCEKILKEIVPPETFLLPVHRFKNFTTVPVQPYVQSAKVKWLYGFMDPGAKKGELIGVDSPQTVRTTRARAVLKQTSNKYFKCCHHYQELEILSKI